MSFALTAFSLAGSMFAEKGWLTFLQSMYYKRATSALFGQSS